MKKRLFCSFPPDLIKEPLLFTMGKEFGVVPNIRGASVTDTVAILSLELEGGDDQVEAAEAYLLDKGVQVEVLQPDSQA